MKGRVIVIGASWGGIAALKQIVRDLPADLPAAVVVVQHTGADSPRMLADILAAAGPLPAAYARDGEPLLPGRIYVAPPDHHLLVGAQGRLQLSRGPKENRSRPSIDPTFRSAAAVYGSAAVGVVLTGHLDDGTAGLLAIKDRGGVAVVQEPDEAEAPSMPLSALRHVDVDHRRNLRAMAPLLVELSSDPWPEREHDMTEKAMKAEVNIAAGAPLADAWREFEKSGTPSGLNCPDCRSALYELADKRLLRFRCRAGHGFTGRSLLHGQTEARENLLSSMFGALIEEAALSERLAQDEGAGTGADRAADVAPGRTALNQHAARLHDHAGRIVAWLGEGRLPDPGR